MPEEIKSEEANNENPEAPVAETSDIPAHLAAADENVLAKANQSEVVLPAPVDLAEPAGEILTEPGLAETAEPAETVEPAERRWFIIFAKDGYENRVRAAIEERINSTDLGQRVFRVLVPEEEIIELRQNRRVERMKKMFPGYVFVEMILTEETWYRIRSIPGVSRFIGAHKMPVPVAEKEMQRVLRQIGMKEETQIETDFEKGEGIRIISGPFRGYVGTIEECHPEKGKLRAFISIFGRDTPVELDFSQVERA